MTEFNIELMKRVRRAISTKRFNQGAWREAVAFNHPVTGEPLSRPVDAGDVGELVDADIPRDQLVARCSTAMCIAGWATELDPRMSWVLTDQELALLALHGLSFSDDAYGDDDDANAESNYVVVSDPNLSRQIEDGYATPIRLRRPLPQGGVVPAFHVQTAAMYALGLTEAQALYLFAGDLASEDARIFLDMAIDGMPIPEDDVITIKRAVREQQSGNDDVVTTS